MNEDQSLALAQQEAERENARAEMQEEHRLRVEAAEATWRRTYEVAERARTSANGARNAIRDFQRQHAERVDGVHEGIARLRAAAPGQLREALVEARRGLAGSMPLDGSRLTALAVAYIAASDGFAEALHRALEQPEEAGTRPLSPLTGEQVREQVGRARQHEQAAKAAADHAGELVALAAGERQGIELEGRHDLGRIEGAADGAEAAAQEAEEALRRTRAALETTDEGSE